MLSENTAWKRLELLWKIAFGKTMQKVSVLTGVVFFYIKHRLESVESYLWGEDKNSTPQIFLWDAGPGAAGWMGCTYESTGSLWHMVLHPARMIPLFTG